MKALRLACGSFAGSALGRWTIDRVCPDHIAIFLWHSVGRGDRRRTAFFDAEAIAARLSSHCDLETFASQLDFITRRFTVRSLAEAIELLRSRARGYGPVAVLTFDDAFANVAEDAVPVLEARGLPCCIFVNAALAGGGRLRDHDLLLFAVNVSGPEAVAAVLADHNVPAPAPKSARRAGDFDLSAIATHPAWSGARRSLLDLLGSSEQAIADEVRPFASWEQLRALPPSVSFGNHGAAHLRLRGLADPAIEREIVGGLAELRASLGVVDVPYAFAFGQPEDMPPAAQRLAAAHHTAVLSAFGGVNLPTTPLSRLQRVPVFSSPQPRLLVEYTYPPRTWLAMMARD